MSDYLMVRDAICRPASKSTPLPVNQNTLVVMPKGMGIPANQNVAPSHQRKKPNRLIGSKFFEQLHASSVGGVPSGTPPRRARSPAETKTRILPLSTRVPNHIRLLAEAKAKAGGISTNRFCRRAIEAAIYDEKFVLPPPPDHLAEVQEVLTKLVVEQSRQGNNLNQLTANANLALKRGECIPSIDFALKELAKGQKNIVNTLADIQKWILSFNEASTITDRDRIP